MKKIVTIIAVTVVWWGIIIGSAIWHIPAKDITISELIKSSPVPVNFVNSMNSPNIGDAIGAFGGQPLRIEILNSLCNCMKLVVLVHEIGHAICDAENCGCMKNPDHTEREIHAIEFTLSWLLKHKQKEILKQEMECITKQANGFSSYQYYINAASHITKTELWQKCLKYINE